MTARPDVPALDRGARSSAGPTASAPRTAWALDPVVVACSVVAVTLEIVDGIGWPRLPAVAVGRVPLGADLLVVPALLWAAGRAGALVLRWATWWRAYVLLGAATALGLSIYVDRTGTTASAVALFLACLGEELAFRFAALVVFGLVAAAARRRMGSGAPPDGPDNDDGLTTASWTGAVWASAIVASAVLFAVMPGHRAQMHSVELVLPFLAFPLLLGAIVARTGTIVPGVLVHFGFNLLALSVLEGTVGAAPATAARVVLVLALAIGIGRVHRRPMAGAEDAQMRSSPRVIVIE